MGEKSWRKGLVGECEEIQGEAGECRPNTNAERSFEKQVVVNFLKINFVTKAIGRPPVSQFIREITRATEEDRKRRYAMHLCLCFSSGSGVFMWME